MQPHVQLDQAKADVKSGIVALGILCLIPILMTYTIIIDTENASRWFLGFGSLGFGIFIGRLSMPITKRIADAFEIIRHADK
jgi:hypothetical protein